MGDAEATSPYMKIAGEIEERVRTGDLRPGDRVPSTRQITKQWGVAIATATKALAELTARGLVRPIPGVGTVVADPRPLAAPSPSHAHPVTPASRRTGAAEITRERIIQVAIDIADAEGIAALSMRRIAVDMDVATMSLYRWITSKDDLVVGMMDRLMGAGEWPAAPPAGWRAQLEYVARRQWGGYCEHPWLAHVVSLTRPQLSPGAMVHTEWVLQALDPYDLDDMTKFNIVLTLFGHIKGAANGLEAERQAQRDTGLDIDEWMRANDAAFEPTMRSGKFPLLAKLGENQGINLDLTGLFEFGLTMLLDGFADLIAGARRAPR
jgi:DNA-binding transcriptional regulator YhcF (GntR family)